MSGGKATSKKKYTSGSHVSYSDMVKKEGFDLVAPHRQLELEGRVQEFSMKQRKLKYRDFFLFNDLLMKATRCVRGPLIATVSCERSGTARQEKHKERQ
eukprot:SAG22_NODE_1186_length_5219_cov_345.307227_3_plen_99_part_00